MKKVYAISTEGYTEGNEYEHECSDELGELLSKLLQNKENGQLTEVDLKVLDYNEELVDLMNSIYDEVLEDEATEYLDDPYSPNWECLADSDWLKDDLASGVFEPETSFEDYLAEEGLNIDDFKEMGFNSKEEYKKDLIDEWRGDLFEEYFEFVEGMDWEDRVERCGLDLSAIDKDWAIIRVE